MGWDTENKAAIGGSINLMSYFQKVNDSHNHNTRNNCEFCD